MTIDQDAAEFLQGGGATAKFPTIGTTVKGTLLSIQKRQQTDFDTGKPLTWDNGDPRWELVITLQTDEHDSDTDDGQRRIFAKANLLTAVRDAFKKAGAQPEVGGILAVQYTGDGEPSKKGLNPPKLYTAQYKAPAIQAGDLLGGPAPSGADIL